MAEKKTAQAAQDEYVDVYVPKERKGDDALFVSVNGRRIMIRKGETVRVPAMYAEVLENSRRMAKAADKFIEANAQV